MALWLENLEFTLRFHSYDVNSTQYYKSRDDKKLMLYPYKKRYDEQLIKLKNQNDLIYF